MTDLTDTIIAKSDQLNADDLIGRTLTIKITKVSGCPEPQQPIAINFEGDNGKPFKPCKSMRRVLVYIWDRDGAQYVGRKMTLYRDPKVRFGGVEVGGIRISHMSDITEPVTMALAESKASRKPFTVKPLIEPKPAATQAKKPKTWGDFLDELEPELAGAETKDAVDAILARDLVHKAQDTLKNGSLERLNKMITNAIRRTSEPDATEAEEIPADAPAPEALTAATHDMVRHIAGRDKATLPALTASGAYQRLVTDLEKSGNFDLMNRIRDANSAAMLRTGEIEEV